VTVLLLTDRDLALRSLEVGVPEAA